VKTHARNTAIGGVLLPIALLIAAAIANEGQALLGLELDRVSLAIFLLPFLYGCAEAMKALMKLEASRIGKDLLGSLDGLGNLFSGDPSSTPPIPIVPTTPPPAGAAAPPPPPPPAGGLGGDGR